jgi:hypothetical protein
MANPLLGEVALPKMNVAGFEAGGIVVLDFNALCSLESELAQTIDEIGTAVLESPTMMRSVLRVALEEHHGKVDDRIVGKIIQAIGADAAAEIILKSFTLAFPEAANGTGNPPKPPAKKNRAGTGGAALKSGAK